MRFTIGQTVLISLVLFIAGASTLKADKLVGGTLTNWNPNLLYGFGGYIPGLYYWNNGSGDGTEANIGWCLVGNNQCGSQTLPGYTPPGYMQYMSANGAAPSNMYFTGSGDSLNLTLQFSLTDQKGGTNGVDVFGYYITDSTGTAILSTGVAFTSEDANGSQFTLPVMSVGEHYGFFIENIQGLNTPDQTNYSYYMDEADNSATGLMPADSFQHFAVFWDGSSYYVGATDGDACEGNFVPGSSPCIPSSQFDFNDMVVEISTNTPEPGSIFLLSVGLLAAAPYLRRRIVP